MIMMTINDTHYKRFFTGVIVMVAQTVLKFVKCISGNALFLNIRISGQLNKI